jgi:N-acyl-D-amino-acid deacylase
MNRREFVRATVTTAAGLLLRQREMSATVAPPVTIILRNATIYDGTNTPPITGDVAIADDRITAIGRHLDVPGAEIIDLRGLALAPGFIDIHSHTDRVLLTNPFADVRVRQGVTMEIAGQDGSSIANVAQFMTQLEQAPASLNWATMIGAGSIRQRVVGNDDRPATAQELARSASRKCATHCARASSDCPVASSIRPAVLHPSMS